MPQLRTLGSVAVVEQTANGERHFDVQQKRLALLVFIARGGRGPFARRDALVAHFWPDSDEHHARGVLRQALTAFRKELGADVLVTRGEDEVGLAPNALTCDATAFEAACKAGEYEAACTLYRGHFLEGFHTSGASPDFEQWVDSERDRLRRLASDASWRVASRLEAEGRTTEAVDRARRAVELDPDDEQGVARLISLLDQHGDRSGALTVYAALERRLAEGFSAQPAPETRALMKALRQRPTPVYNPPPAQPVTQAVGSVAPVVHTAVSTRPRQPFFMAGAVGALAVIALALLLGPTRPAARSTAASLATVAVAPFRVHSPDADLAWLRDGMVELLTMRLSGTGGMTVIEPGRVLAAWHGLPGDSLKEEPAATLAKFASQVGAGRIVRGSVTGTADHLALAVWIVDVAEGDNEAQATIEGPADSLAFLVDRLSAKLLGLAAGVESHRLISLEGAPLTAIRAFLAGREAARKGRTKEAILRYREALVIDSTFALAGLDLLRATAWGGTDADRQLGARISRKHSSRLSQPDRALLAAIQGQWTNAPGIFERWSDAVAAYPDRQETWYELGDAYFHWGALAGVPDPFARAEEAFRRGWALDSAAREGLGLAGPLVAEPMVHMVQLAHMKGDTAEVLRLSALVLAADSSSDLAGSVRWDRARMQGNAAIEAYWARSSSLSEESLHDIVHFTVWSGVDATDYSRAREENEPRIRRRKPGFMANALAAMALNGGRPSQVPPVRVYHGYAPREELRRTLKEALFWGGDSMAARAAAARLSLTADAPPKRGPAARSQYQDICALGLWRAARGDAGAAATAARRLRVTRIPGLTGLDSVSFVQYRDFCPALLDALRAVMIGTPKAGALVAVADSMSRVNIFEVCCGEAVTDANLILARLWEATGDTASALRAVRRRAGGYFLEPLYISTFLREEGRLAALTGDTVGAIRSYRHYLAIRPNPEPAAQAETEQVEQALAALGARPMLARAP